VTSQESLKRHQYQIENSGKELKIQLVRETMNSQGDITNENIRKLDNIKNLCRCMIKDKYPTKITPLTKSLFY
jgi:hypothetical protein